MKRLKSLIIFVAAIMLFTGCSKDNDLESLINENEELKEELIKLEQRIQGYEQLRLELESIKYSEFYLLNELNICLGNKEYNKALDIIYTIVQKQPDSPEAAKAAEIKAQIMAAVSGSKGKNNIEASTKDLADIAKNIKTRFDEEKQMDWHVHNSSPSKNDVNAFYLYYGMKEKNLPWLRMRIQYAGEGYLDITKFTINADNHLYEIVPPQFAVKKDKMGELAWEWYDASVENNVYKIFKAAANAEKASIICVGNIKSYERTLSASEKQALKYIIASYELSGGFISDVQ